MPMHIIIHNLLTYKFMESTEILKVSFSDSCRKKMLGIESLNTNIAYSFNV